MRDIIYFVDFSLPILSPRLQFQHAYDGFSLLFTRAGFARPPSRFDEITFAMMLPNDMELALMLLLLPHLVPPRQSKMPAQYWTAWIVF
jgi:hypothetical protein